MATAFVTAATRRALDCLGRRAVPSAKMIGDQRKIGRLLDEIDGYSKRDDGGGKN